MDDEKRSLEAFSGSDPVIEPEIVGLDAPPASPWRRLLTRLLLVVFLGLVGLGLCAVGGIMTLTIVGAPLGIPILLLGLALLAFLSFFLLSGGSLSTVTIRRGRF